jgi:tRNA (mo5U34)-methyltransferase
MSDATSLTWLQSIRLGPDRVTDGVRSETELAQMEEALFGPIALAGAHVLEVGAWNGAFSLAAKRRGAARVLATDHLAWTLAGSDVKAAVELASRETGLEIETEVVDPRSLSADFGEFHVVVATEYFTQIFNPIAGLKGLRAVTSRLLLLETIQDGMEESRPVMMAHAMPTAYGVAVAGWAPNPEAVKHMLLELGFDRIFHRDHPTAGRARGLYAAVLPGTPDEALTDFVTPWRSLTHPD